MKKIADIVHYNSGGVLHRMTVEEDEHGYYNAPLSMSRMLAAGDYITVDNEREVDDDYDLCNLSDI